MTLLDGHSDLEIVTPSGATMAFSAANQHCELQAGWEILGAELLRLGNSDEGAT